MPGWLTGLLLVVTAVRVAAADALPVHHDEAYYWLWSRRLDWGYLDHPPMIAWLLAATTRLAGDGPLGIRLGPVILGAAAVYAVFLLGRDLFGARAGARAALVMLAVPALSASGVLAAPDTPLLLAWIVAVRFAWQAVEGRPGRWRATGAAAGAGLLSKLLAAFLPVGLLGFLLARGRPHLRRRGPYVAAVVALVLFSPVVAWNARHDWAGLSFVLRDRSQLAAFAPGIPATVGFLTDHLAITALTAPVFLWALWVCWHRRAEVRFAFLWWTAAPLVLATAAAVPLGAARGAWPVPAYAVLAVALGALWPRPAAAAMAGAGAVQAAFALLVLVPWLPPFPGAREYVGWDQAGARATAEIRTLGPGGVLVADRYEVAAHLAYHTRDAFPLLYVPPAADRVGLAGSRNARRGRWGGDHLRRPPASGGRVLPAGGGGRHVRRRLPGSANQRVPRRSTARLQAGVRGVAVTVGLEQDSDVCRSILCSTLVNGACRVAAKAVLKRGRADADILTVDQVAAYLQLNRLTVYRYIREGRIAAARFGKVYRVRKGDVDRFLESHKVASRPGPRPAPPRAARVRAIRPRAANEREVSVGPPWHERLRERRAVAERVDVRTSAPVEWVLRGMH